MRPCACSGPVSGRRIGAPVKRFVPMKGYGFLEPEDGTAYRSGDGSRLPGSGPTGFTHLFPLALYCMPPSVAPSVAPASEPGPSLGFRGNRKRFALLSTGCGGIRSHGWTPAFARGDESGRSAAWPGHGRNGRTSKTRLCIR